MYHRRPSGFTLVELLIVMAILGILFGLLAWGVSAARTAILKRAQKFEIEMIAQAIEQYKTKYGDYPPDGSSWPIVEAHLRKAFPNILVTELNLLNPSFSGANGYIRNDNDLTGSHPHLPLYPPGLRSGRVMDSAEALVFFLGGFSSDQQRPLTGPGGPFASNPAVAGAFIYNTQRENAFFEFKTNRLTLDGGVSTDEGIYGEGVGADLLPVYVGAGPSIQQGGVPIVYFDSRTYQMGGTTVGDTSYYFNFYSPGLVNPSNAAQCTRNCVRPFLSTDKDPTSGALRYANNKTYQIVNGGYDRIYGCQSVKNIAPPESKPSFLFTVPGGHAAELNPASMKFFMPPTGSAIRFYNPEFWIDSPSAPISAHTYVDDNTSNIVDTPTFGESL